MSFNPSQIKIIFFGTPEFAAVILRSLIENKFDIAAVFTQPDKKIGRKQKVVYSSVKKLALENKIQVFQPQSLRQEDIIEKIKNIKPDLFIVAAYGRILPKAMLDIPKYGAINIHASLLPKYRGASPVQSAILAGEKETGITLMRMNEKMDEGDILAQERIKIGKNKTADDVLLDLSKLGAKMIMEFIPDWIQRKIKPVLQDHSEASYCKPVKREDGKIDWNLTAEGIFRRWRAYHPWPGIFSAANLNSQPKRLKLLDIEIIQKAETSEKPGEIVRYSQEIAVQAKKGLIVLKKIQLEGKREMKIEEFVRGYPEFVGSILN